MLEELSRVMFTNSKWWVIGGLAFSFVLFYVA